MPESASIAELEPEDKLSTVATGDAPSVIVVDDPCPNCQKPFPSGQPWCKHCGFYPALNRCIELDPWDQLADETAAVATAPNHFEVWRNLIPAWGWKLVAGVAVIFVVSLAARMVLPSEGTSRMVWSLSQIAIGVAALVAGHVACYLYAILENDRLNMLDIIIKPLSIWITVARDLPETFFRVATGVWGASGIALAMLIVGGLPYERLMDWGGEPAKMNLVHAITEQAQQAAGDGAGNLEDAVQDFAGKAAVKEPDAEEQKRLNERKLSADCLIIGFTPWGDDNFGSLLLASDVDGRLRYVGSVGGDIPDDARAELNAQLRNLLRDKPFVPVKLNGAFWVEPKLTCRVRFRSWNQDRRMTKPLFDKLLNEIDVNSAR